MGSIFNQKENNYINKRNTILKQQKTLQPIFYTLKGDDLAGKYF